MKSKTKTYILLTVVLGIWGVIGYKLWNGFTPEISRMPYYDKAVVFNPSHSTEIDTFSVQMLNRDPFLGTIMRPKTKVVSKTKKKPPLVWPAISYQGVIKGQTAKQQLFVVTINGQQQLLGKAQLFNEVKLIKGTPKYILVAYKGKQKKIVVQ